MLKYILFMPAIWYPVLVSAQVPVRDEPRHHNVFENEFVRILDVHLGPKDTTLYHLHNTPSVFIIFTNTNVGSQLLGKQPQKGANITGMVSYDSLATPRIHRVWNEDTSWFHVMDVELTGKKFITNLPVLQKPFLKLLFNEKEINGYSLEVKPGRDLQLPPPIYGYLLLSQGGSEVEFKINEAVQHRIMKSSHYIWIEAGKDFSIKTKNKAISFVLLQLK